jgi:hypothetical protein
MNINIDKWILGYKVKAFNWIDGKRIYFNVQYYLPGQSIERPPVWDKTVFITENDNGYKLINDFIYTLVEHVANMQIKEGFEITITA